MFRIALSGACLLGFLSIAQAHDFRQGDLEIGNPWARPTPPVAKNGAVYLTIKNAGKEPDKLVSAQTPAAEKAEIHEHIHEGDIMKMRAVPDGVAVPPGQTVAFQPAGYHIMLVGLKHQLKEGEKVPLKLSFAKAGEVNVEVTIGKTASDQNMGGMHMH